MAKLPDCGLYRTKADVGGIPAGRLVYFHNHGEPGPGLYLPERWNHNRAAFSDRGHTLATPYEQSAALLEPLPAEGLYRVREAFPCCPKNCHVFEADLLVQLGYDGEGNAILFTPTFGKAGIDLPESGTAVDRDRLGKIAPLKVVEESAAPPTDQPPPGAWLH